MKKRIVSTLPLISIFLLLLFGLGFDNWKLGIIFILLIPVFTILLSDHVARQLNRHMPFIALILFLWLTIGFDLAHPGWLVFFLIPLSDMIYHKRFYPRKIVGVVIVSLYIIIGVLYPQSFFPESLQIFGESFWHPGWVMLLLIPIINNIFLPQSHRFIHIDKEKIKEKFKDYIYDEDEKF
jgi:uncharacterized membrane protein YoaK (UPF0700 family)